MTTDSELADLEYTWLTRLTSIRQNGVSLRGMPNKPKEYGATQDQGQVALVFMGRDYVSDFSAIADIMSTEVTNFKLDIRLKEMRSNVIRDGTAMYGSQYIVKDILNLILGTQIKGYLPTKVSSLRFVGESDDFWVYELNFNMQRSISIPVTLIDLLNAGEIIITPGEGYDDPLPTAPDGTITIITGFYISEPGFVGQIPPSVKVGEIPIKLDP